MCVRVVVREIYYVRALATDSLKESVSLHLGKKREKTTKTPPQQKPYI
jgi:hypothetical protein